MQKIAYEPGQTILTEGEHGSTAFLVVSGVIEVLVGPGAKAKRVATMTAGEVFGEVSLLDPGPRSATVRAVTRVECTVASYDDFISSIQSDPEKAVAFMRTLVRRLRQTNEMLVQMDPQKRGIRGLLADVQRSVSSTISTPNMTQANWYEFNTV
jgi:CRP/FNR family transcriptional regulator, cyclic AMP receptor protein